MELQAGKRTAPGLVVNLCIMQQEYADAALTCAHVVPLSSRFLLLI